MHEHVSNGLTAATYTLCGSIIVGDVLDMFDAHAWLPAFLLGLLTYFTGLLFKILDRRRKCKT